MVLISCEKPMKVFVEKWRSENDDWRSLAAFLNEKVTRRMSKKKKQAETLDGKHKSEAPYEAEGDGGGQEAVENDEDGEDDPDDNHSSAEDEDVCEEETEEPAAAEKKPAEINGAKASNKKAITEKASAIAESSTKTGGLAKDPPTAKRKAPVEKMRNGMIVKKLDLANLDNLDGDFAIDFGQDDGAEVVFQSSGAKDKKRKLGSMFVGFESDDESDVPVEPVPPSQNIAEDEGLVECTFIGSLSGNRNAPYKSVQVKGRR
jgi:hypothetical protein